MTLLNIVNFYVRKYSCFYCFFCHVLFILSYRGGASEASVATLTDYVAGARDLSYVRQISPQALIALRACAMVAESAMSETFFAGKKIWQRKLNLTRTSIDPETWCMKDQCIHH